MKRDGIAARIAIAALVVAGVTLAIVAIGVMRVGSDAFAAAMAAAGDSVEHARQMFDSSVSLVVLLAGVVAAIGAVILATLLARRIARPIEHLAEIAERTAEGDLTTMAPMRDRPRFAPSRRPTTSWSTGWPSRRRSAASSS